VALPQPRQLSYAFAYTNRHNKGRVLELEHPTSIGAAEFEIFRIQPAATNLAEPLLPICHSANGLWSSAAYTGAAPQQVFGVLCHMAKTDCTFAPLPRNVYCV